MGPTPKDRPVYKSGLGQHMEIIEIKGLTQDLETRNSIKVKINYA